MSLRRLDSIVAELLPKIAERYRAQQIRDDSHSEHTNARTNQQPPSDRTVGAATASAERPPA